MDTAVSVELFVEILNRYVYYFDQQNEAVSCFRLTLHKCGQPADNHGLGYDEISQRPDRAHPFQFANRPGAQRRNSGESEEALSANAGIYQVEGV
jgi:hypothetical protein